MVICSDHEKVLDDIGTETAMLNPFLINSDFFQAGFPFVWIQSNFEHVGGDVEKGFAFR